MPEMNLVQAVNDALRVEMRRDPRMVVLGEDVGRFGGVFRATVDLQEEFGPDRCIDTPLAESGIIGAAIGMALYGLRPVPEIQFGDYVYPAVRSDRERAGQVPVPLGRRVPGAGRRAHADRRRHQGRALSFAVARGFLHAHSGAEGRLPIEPGRREGAARQRDPRRRPGDLHGAEALLPGAGGDVPAGEYTIPLGEAKVVREGRQVTVIAWSAMVQTALDAAEQGRRARFDLEVIDLRTLVPFDVERILASVKKTGRVVIVHEAPKTSGFGGELAATIQEKAILHLEAPILRVTGFDTPFPYTLEHEYLPDANRVLTRSSAW